MTSLLVDLGTYLKLYHTSHPGESCLPSRPHKPKVRLVVGGYLMSEMLGKNLAVFGVISSL